MTSSARPTSGLGHSQAQLIQTERLRALDEMAAGVAHDFNNLLAVILGRAELLQRRTTDPESKRGLEAVRDAAQDGADTVRRIQEFTRTRQILSFGAVDILDVVREDRQMGGQSVPDGRQGPPRRSGEGHN